MKLQRIEQPHPEWNLKRCCRALYGAKENRRRYLSCKCDWGETKETLEEFCELEELGDYEWRREARKQLADMEAEEADMAAEEKAAAEAESWCRAPFDFNDTTTMASVGACACMSPVVLGVLFNWSSMFQ